VDECKPLIDGVFHSMSQVGTFDGPSKDVWYGSEEVVDLWLGALALESGLPVTQQKGVWMV